MFIVLAWVGMHFMVCGWFHMHFHAFCMGLHVFPWGLAWFRTYFDGVGMDWHVFAWFWHGCLCIPMRFAWSPLALSLFLRGLACIYISFILFRMYRPLAKINGFFNKVFC